MVEHEVKERKRKGNFMFSHAFAYNENSLIEFLKDFHFIYSLDTILEINCRKINKYLNFKLSIITFTRKLKFSCIFCLEELKFVQT